MYQIPFEKPLIDLENQIDRLRREASTQGVAYDKEIASLEKKSQKLRQKVFKTLTPYEITQLSRHPKRPNVLEIISSMADSFVELHGDRNFFDDPSIIGGLAKIEKTSFVVIGHQKGRGTKDNIKRNFGMPKPEGYRKALRLMSMAERFQLPIVTLIDTPGAYPGISAEERGQAEAIGKNIMVMSNLKVPIICFVTGEGGSGGALALGVGDRVYMLEYATYSVISPEGCASILLKDARQASTMAKSLQITATSAQKLGVIDGILKEPEGGAHRNIRQTSKSIAKQIIEDITCLQKLKKEELCNQRQQKFLSMGAFSS